MSVESLSSVSVDATCVNEGMRGFAVTAFRTHGIATRPKRTVEGDTRSTSSLSSDTVVVKYIGPVIDVGRYAATAGPVPRRSLPDPQSDLSPALPSGLSSCFGRCLPGPLRGPNLVSKSLHNLDANTCSEGLSECFKLHPSFVAHFVHRV